MYQGLKEHFWWNGIKGDVAKYVSMFLTYQKVKAKRKHPADELQPIELPEWKWDQITMDFVVDLPRIIEGYNAIWVVMDQLTKSAHFIMIKVTFSVERLTEIYMANIVRIHGVPISIIFDWDHFSHFWKCVQKALETQLKFTTALHPQMDGQYERTILTLEDTLRACVIDFGGSWNKKLLLIEFSCNKATKHP